MGIQTAIAIGIISLIIFLLAKRPRIGANEPPLVPYTIPILGHTYQYLFNSREFLEKCQKQYGECFSIYIFGSVVTLISRKHVNEVFRNHNDFDFTQAAKEVLPFDLLFTYNGGGTDHEAIKFHIETVRTQVSGKLDTNLPVVQKYLAKGIDKWIGDCNDPKVFNNAWVMFNNIITSPVANIFVGEEAASHEDLLKTFANFTFDISSLLTVPPIFTFIHKKLHAFIVTIPLRFGWNPVSHHREVIANRLRPVVEKRLKERIELGDKYKPYNDVLDYYMSQPNFDYSKPDNLYYHIENIFMLIFAAITTTSRATTNALFDLAGRPECLNELYEEALEINKACNGKLTTSDIQKMKKLDSFVKESLRHGDNLIGFSRYMVSKSFTFSNGFTIPEGRLTRMCVDSSLKSKENFGDDAEEFKPFRFVDTDSPATKVDRSFIVFGGGRHACPGRYFAVNETKLLLHNLMLKYNISTESGKIEDKLASGPSREPPRSGIIFQNRQ